MRLHIQQVMQDTTAWEVESYAADHVSSLCPGTRVILEVVGCGMNQVCLFAWLLYHRLNTDSELNAVLTGPSSRHICCIRVVSRVSCVLPGRLWCASKSDNGSHS